MVLIVRRNWNTDKRKHGNTTKIAIWKNMWETERRGWNGDSDECDSDDSDQSLEPYDGFTGDFDMLQISNGKSV